MGRGKFGQVRRYQLGIDGLIILIKMTNRGDDPNTCTAKLPMSYLVRFPPGCNFPPGCKPMGIKPPVPRMHSRVRPPPASSQRTAPSPSCCPAPSPSLCVLCSFILRAQEIVAQPALAEPLVDAEALDLHLGKSLDGQGGAAAFVRHGTPPVLPAHGPMLLGHDTMCRGHGPMCREHGRRAVPYGGAAPLRPWSELVAVKAVDQHFGKSRNGKWERLVDLVHASTSLAS
jgi:hypothetical protein